MRTIILSLAAGLALLVEATTAQAALMYQFADAAGAPASSFSISSVGGTVEVQVYLRETAGTTFLDDDLFSAGVQVTFNNPTGVAAVQAVGHITPNAGFVNLIPAPSVSSTNAGLTGDVGFDPFLTPDGDNRIFLGTFRFTGLSGGTVTITALDRDPTTQDTFTGAFIELDDLIGTATAAIVVHDAGQPSAVPEPGSMVLAGIGIAGLLTFAWRRRATCTS